ncbi:hypothetical protein GJ496_001550 [Pomphorhynchus laevis]|nr:hypothetical protein GJ496_001550 [Pomphorhynchus laevis]
MSTTDEISMENLLCVPGDRLCGELDAKPGFGTYVKNGLIFASIRGVLNITAENEDDIEDDGKVVINVMHVKPPQPRPEIGSIVCCKITFVHKSNAKCIILSVNNVAVNSPFNGVIKKRSVRSYRRDILEIINCFRPGDIVLARVISLGETDFYYLSTLETELGVVIGLSKTGERMYPISWNRMKTLNSYVPDRSEPRKVAKVRPEFIIDDEDEADDDLS